MARTLVIRSLLLLSATLGGACKKEESCNPGQVQWGVQLLIDATTMINPDANGEALPTVVRLYQVRGEIVLDNLDFATVWESDDVEKLGDGFLAVEELTIYPDQNDQRLLPIEPDATHIVATGWFREPLGTTWFGSYEIPLRHPDVVCKKAPESKIYPNPCFYVLLDRSAIAGGATPPAGFETGAPTQCAPLGVVVEESGGKKKRKKKKKKKRRPDLEDPLRSGAEDQVEDARPQVPDSPPRDAPSRPTIDAPQRPDTSSAPSRDSVPSGDPR